MKSTLSKLTVRTMTACAMVALMGCAGVGLVTETSEVSVAAVAATAAQDSGTVELTEAAHASDDRAVEWPSEWAWAVVR